MTLAACQTAPPKPMETIEDTVEVSATVEKVDVLNRLLSLKTESGEVVTVEVGPEVQNLVQVRPGDRVVARYRQAIGATISKDAAGQPVTVDVDADKGQAWSETVRQGLEDHQRPGDDHYGGYQDQPGHVPRRRRPGAGVHGPDAAGEGVHQAAQARRHRGRDLHRGLALSVEPAK